jgi:hypothetical protein
MSDGMQENMGKHSGVISGTALDTANMPVITVPAKPADLTQRQENFARLFLETGVAVEAYRAAYNAEGSSQAAARVEAYRLLRKPKVAARVRELQDAAADRSIRSTAALIAELEEMVAVDVNEVMRLDVGACRFCWSEGRYHWRDNAELAAAVDAWMASLGGPKPLPAPDTAGPVGYQPNREPNADCAACAGTGVPRVKFTSTADVSPAARRLLRGIELFPDGQVKRVLLHDQTQLRAELHKLRGMHVDRSLNLNLNATVPALPKNLSVAEALRILETIAPAPTEAEPIDVVSDQ